MRKLSSSGSTVWHDGFQPRTGDPVIVDFVENLRRLGRKDRQGFYDYPEEGEKRLWPGLSEVYEPAPNQPGVEAVKRRLLYIQGVEAARCLEEGVILGSGDADVASILGWGFPRYTGGVLSMVHTMGIETFVSGCVELMKSYGPRFDPPEILRGMAVSGETLFAA